MYAIVYSDVNIVRYTRKYVPHYASVPGSSMKNRLRTPYRKPRAVLAAANRCADDLLMGI